MSVIGGADGEGEEPTLSHRLIRVTTWGGSNARLAAELSSLGHGDPRLWSLVPFGTLGREKQAVVVWGSKGRPRAPAACTSSVSVGLLCGLTCLLFAVCCLLIHK